MFKLSIEKDAPCFIRECAVEASAVLGFYSLSMDFPVLRPGGARSEEGCPLVRLGHDESLREPFSLTVSGKDITLTVRDSGGAEEALAALCSVLAPGAPPSPEPSNVPAVYEHMSTGYQKRPLKRGLESLFDRGFLVKDGDRDFLPDEIHACITLPGGFDDYMLSAACDIACRLGMETLELKLPLLLPTGKDAGTKARISFEHAETCAVVLDERAVPAGISVQGMGEDLSRMVSKICGSFPEAGNGSTWFEMCGNISSGLAMRNLDGQLSWLASGLAHGAAAGETVLYADPSVESKRALLEKEFPSVRFKNRRDLAVIREKEYELPWEVEVCKKRLEESVYPLVRKGGSYEVSLVISEDNQTRKALEYEIKNTLAAKGCVDSVVRVVCAFKQGFSWIRDYILPELRGRSGIESVEIGFTAFLPEGRGEWSDEYSAMPKINVQRRDSPDSWMDTPIRLLQELYPIDDCVAELLAINRDRVQFKLLEDEGAFRGYRLRAYGKNSGLLYEAAHEVAFSERPYLDAYPGIGKVHPGTGSITLRENGSGKLLHESNFQTDMETIWAVYQSEVLPAAADHIRKVCGGTLQSSKQPFFAQLRLDIDASEPEEKLPFRQDRISSLDSLHEDIYFTGLDFFQTLGVRECGSAIDSPGLILPVIRKKNGAPRMKFTLLAELSPRPAIESGGKRRGGEAGGAGGIEAGDADVYISRFDFAAGELCPRIRVVAKDGRASEAEAFISSWADLLEKGLLDASLDMAGIPQARFESGGAVKTIRSPVPVPKTEKLDIRDIDVPEGTLFGYDEYLELIGKFAQVPKLRVRKIAESRLGRDIHSIEILPDLEGYVSKTKLIAERPVYYVNARHHANEVSSTNAAFMLIKKLLSDPEYAGIENRLNIVVVPFENPDGAAIHYDLAADNPEWILHIARYNSLGREISFEYFKDNTIHTEALAFTEVWREWLPDMVSDNHGVPSHEWCQQFAGYTSPWFKGFWMPRSLLYGCYWYLTHGEYAANKKFAEASADAIADMVGADSECDALNREWKDRFEKYAHAWLPKQFPAEYYKGMIFYWVPYEYKPDSYYASVRFPQVTAVHFVSEVSDETARDDYLVLCARTHMINDLAAIRMMQRGRTTFRDIVKKENGVIRCSRKRNRPLEVVPHDPI